MLIEVNDKVIFNARKSSLLNQGEVAGFLGVTTPTYLSREKEPETFTLREIREIFQHMSTDGKSAIREWGKCFFDLL